MKQHNCIGLNLLRHSLVSILMCLPLAVFLSIPVTVHATSLTDQQRLEIEALIGDIRERGHYPGISIQVDRGGETIFAGGFGMADIENETPARADTAYPIGSITKSFTALMVLQLVVADKLKLEDSVKDHLPEYSGPASVVQIWQLLNHTSGIPNYTSISGVRDRLTREKISRQEMVSFFSDLPLQFEPGSRFNYTNSGYYLLGLIVEKLTGEDYYHHLQTVILDAYDLQRTYTGDDRQLVPLRARGYDYGKEGFTNAPPWHFDVPFSAGSIISTVEDLVKYRRAVFNSAMTNKKVQELVTSTRAMNNGQDNPYTLGALIETDFYGHKKYAHSGEIYGFFSDHAYYPNDDLTIAILTNHKGASPTPVSLERKVSRVILGMPPLVVKHYDLSASELEQYTGDFYLDPIQFGPSVYGFVSTEGSLGLRFGGVESAGPILPLIPLGEDRFISILDDEVLITFLWENGAVVGFEALLRDATIFAARTSDQ